MQIVSAEQKYQEEQFMAAVKLEEIDIKNIKKILTTGDEKEINDAISEIINFAKKEGHGMPFVDDEDGEKCILLEIESTRSEIKRKQWILFDDVHEIKNGLRCILASF
ncbi:MAG TPA: hypothetical protein P5323_02205 [Candidatus Moranbacteria bacterium]|jgi:effector-binding domain-containing protein|nr:hypothetical protein [Candidatus Moranbacteria bacterium]HRY27925.1 hypothetical protein [Candidatus Moranbacteria bacterium]HSA08660.1 hypothetical protein [Candidatus Moranbacteria bacterium]